MYKCKSKFCKLKPNVRCRDWVVSTFAKYVFDWRVPNGAIYVDSSSPSGVLTNYLQQMLSIVCSRNSSKNK